MDLYEDVEFPYPDTFNDNYATRCDAARTQEMSIDKNMTFVYIFYGFCCQEDNLEWFAFSFLFKDFVEIVDCVFVGSLVEI